MGHILIGSEFLLSRLCRKSSWAKRRISLCKRDPSQGWGQCYALDSSRSLSWAGFFSRYAPSEWQSEGFWMTFFLITTQPLRKNDIFRGIQMVYFFVTITFFHSKTGIFDC